jgi:hypothetical protein
MSRFSLAKYVTPWSSKKAKERALRIAELRSRDGDNCRRCRRPLRFDLPDGHNLGPKIESFTPVAEGKPETLDNLLLCHGRCNAEGLDLTGEVTERVRRKAEAELFSKSKKRA